jgi:hypothetical protein
MRRLLIAIIVLIPSYLWAAWGSDVVAVWTLDNTKTDDTGHGYTLADVGTGVTFVTDTVYTGYTYSAKGTTNNFARITAGSSLFTYLANKSWTIEGWMYIKNAADGGSGLQYFHGCNLVEAPHPYFVVMQLVNNGTGNSYYANNAGGANWDQVTGWHLISIQYDNTNTYAKYFIDGDLVFGVDTNYNFFTTSPADLYFFADYNNAPNSATRMNKIIVSEALREGAETTPIAATATITPTSTPTVTPTVTETVTPTVTETSTPTVTPTVTQTVTQTVTETVTETVTPTVTETMTETVTQTITQTWTPTSTPTFTPTATPTATATNTPWPEYILNNPGIKDKNYQGPKGRWYNWFIRRLPK